MWNHFLPSHVFKQHKYSTQHKRLEKKLADNSVSVYEQIVLDVEKSNLYKEKCQPTVYMQMDPFQKWLKT